MLQDARFIWSRFNWDERIKKQKIFAPRFLLRKVKMGLLADDVSTRFNRFYASTDFRCLRVIHVITDKRLTKLYRKLENLRTFINKKQTTGVFEIKLVRHDFWKIISGIFIVHNCSKSFYDIYLFINKGYKFVHYFTKTTTF